MPRYTVISADCHAGATYGEGGFLDYVESRHRDLLRDENLRGVWDGETWAHVSASAFGKRGACTRRR